MASPLSTLVTHIVQAERTFCDPSWGEAEEVTFNNPFARLYWVAEGEGFVTHHERRYHLQPGRLYVIPAHTPSRYLCPQRMVLHWLHFTAHVLHKFDLFAFFCCDHVVDITDSAQTQACWERLLRAYKQCDLAGTLQSDGLLRQLLAPFLDTVDVEGQRRRLHELARFTGVLEYIDRHLAEKLTLAELADLVHLQPTYFSNIFSRHMGEGPLVYVNRRRVERAQSLLWQSSASLAEIAQAVGFHDVFYFSRMFKKIAQVSPGQFRRQHAGQTP
ncbi:MAG TPA: helix-turn-helix domain-containing protein [Armatimonadota bacterium]|jgi:AraC-like DNA-binding protein